MSASNTNANKYKHKLRQDHKNDINGEVSQCGFAKYISTLKMPLVTLTVTLMDIFFSAFFSLSLSLNSNSVYQQADILACSLPRNGKEDILTEKKIAE